MPLKTLISQRDIGESFLRGGKEKPQQPSCIMLSTVCKCLSNTYGITTWNISMS